MSRQRENKEQQSAVPQVQQNTEQTITFRFGKSTFKALLMIIAAAILLYWALSHSDKLFTLLGGIMSLLAPFLVGFGIAFIINVLLRPIEKLWDKIFGRSKGKLAKNLKRPIALTLSTLIMLGLIFALVFMVIPEFEKTISNIADSMPQYLEQIKSWWNGVLDWAEGYGIVLPEFTIKTDEIISMASSFISNFDTGILDKTLGITASIFGAIVNFIIAFAFSLYVLAQKETLGEAAKKTLFALLPEKKVSTILDFASLTNQTFTNFVTGQLTEAVIIGILCFIGMLIFGMPYAPVVSVLVGATALIPVFGGFIGTGIGAFLILFVSPIKAVWFVVFIIVLQQLEGNLIYPRVVGKSVGLPGILVLAAVTIGGGAFGIVGMLLSVPTCAVIYSLCKTAVDKRLKEKKM